MYFFLKYILTLFYKKLRIKIVVSLLSEHHELPQCDKDCVILYGMRSRDVIFNGDDNEWLPNINKCIALKLLE